MLVILVPNHQDPRKRTLHFLTHPEEWPHWPFLPLIRRHSSGDFTLGVVYDALHASNLPGYSCTVFLTSLYLLPATESDFLALPKETYDVPEEVFAAGWVLD